MLRRMRGLKYGGRNEFLLLPKYNYYKSNFLLETTLKIEDWNIFTDL